MSQEGRIMLVDVPGWQGAAAGNTPFPNVGIAYLIPALVREGFSVSVIDMNNTAIRDEDLLFAITSFGAQIIGFSVKTATMQNARRLGTLLKRSYPHIPIVVGGPHATVVGRDLQKEPWIDIVVKGEAENTFPQLCRTVLGDCRSKLPGVVVSCQDPGEDVLPALVDDLDSLPCPDYGQFPSAVQEALASFYPLLTSRGCVYRCVYCSVPNISGRRFRRRSLVSIMEELRLAKDRYGIRGFQIIDDAFNVDVERAKHFCKMLIESRLSLSWSCPNGLRADRVDDELADLMARSGCVSVMVGIESADPEVLANAKKGETIEDIAKGIRTFQRAGIPVGGYFIIGLPGDSLQAQLRSVQFAKYMGISAHFNMLIPYPQTELWGWVQTNARMLLDIEYGMHFADNTGTACPVMETDGFSASERIAAYEMTHTLLGQFHMLIPRSMGRWRQLRRIERLIWNYDRSNYAARMFRGLWKRFANGAF